jgi:radical SAM superfamily enzyme YgiQ (UPF0313 family)
MQLDGVRQICLVIPPSTFLLDERVFMTLGILRVAAALEQAGVHVEMVDLSGIQNFEEAIRDHVCASQANVFGLTATTPQMPAAAMICGAIREARPAARLILGGPHVTLVNAARRRERRQGVNGRATKAYDRIARLADVLVAGDGEEAIRVALREDAPKLVDADDPRSTLFLRNERLSELPLPARHLVDVDSYRYHVDGIRALSMIAQLGCPFECGFCGGRESPTFRRVRMRSTENVVAEIVHLYKTYQVRGFMLYDDELNVNPKMLDLMSAIAQTQKDLGTEFRLRGFIKAQLFTEAQAEAMYRAGFRWILVGFESGSPRILKNINKRATREENTRCVQIARRYGLKVKALMSIGHPGESEETVMQTHRWLLEVQPDDFDVTIITTYPGTPYYDHAHPHPSQSDVWVYTYHHDRLYSYEVDYVAVADYYKGNPDGGYKSFVYTDYLTAEALVKLRDFVERDVRKRLGIPFNPSAPAMRYEHSMGQQLPPHILRASLVQQV